MKLTAIILLIACLQVSARGYAQKITLSEKNASLEKVFGEIKKQTEYKFFYDDNLLLNTKHVDITVTDASVEHVLEICLKGQGLMYEIIDKVIIVKQKPTAVRQVSNTSVGNGAFIDIKGRVTNENGEPVAGVTVTVRGTKQATSTNTLGEFSLANTDKNGVLVFSGSNVETFEVNVAGQAEVKVKLMAKVNRLDEVQVIAYGTTTRRLSTGNISTIKAADIEKQPISNALLALEGRVPSLFITQANGIPGGGVTVRIQGQNSYLKGNDPLYVVDGVPYSSQLLPNLGGSILRGSGGVVLNGVPSGSGNPFSYINPSDIESIDVLKDADATAIYGSRAANGAILITTKKGKAGKTKVDINMQSGWGKVTRMLDLLNTQQYLQTRYEALKNDGITTPSATDYDINGLWDTTRYTDWQKKIIGGTSQYRDIMATISGGNASTQFLVGSGYHKETTVFPGDFNDQKGSFHFSLTNTSSDQRFKLQFTGSYMVDKNKLFGSDLTSTAIQLAPNAPALYNADGSLNWMPNATGSSTWTNPLASLYKIYNNKTTNLISNVVLSYEIIKGLDIRSSFGYNDMRIEEFAPSPLLSTRPENRPTTTRTAAYSSGATNTWIIEPQTSYRIVSGNSKIEILVGMTFQENDNKMEQLNGNGYNNDQVLEDIKSASTLTVGSSVNSVYKYNATFGRINYNWRDKYVLNLTTRRDGSTRFGVKDRFHNFGAIGAGWVFSQEKFIQRNQRIISFGKLRASYGTTGNDQIGDYQFMDLYNPISASLPYQGITGISVSSLSNPYLQWEETKKLQIGIDLGVLKDRILLTANYVHNQSSNQLLSYALPIFTGFGGVIKNFPATIQNTAWEFSLSSTNIKSGKFSWTSNLNLTLPNNKLIAFPNLVSSSYATSLFIGQPINIIQAFHFLGVAPGTGIYQFADSHGSPTSSPNFSTDRTALINTLPKFYGGFQNSFNYRGIQLDFLFQFVKQVGPNYFFGSLNGASFNTNQPVSVLKRWVNPGDMTSIQKLNSNFSLFTQASDANGLSDAYYSDASYIRLKNLSLSWQLPEKWWRHVHLQNCRIYIQGQNLLTITNYMGLDPENLSTITLPPLRVLTIGARVGL